MTDNIIWRNKKDHRDCTLVAYFNIRYLLTGEFVLQDSEYYEAISERYACHDSCIAVEKMAKQLNIEEVAILPEWKDLDEAIDLQKQYSKIDVINPFVTMTMHDYNHGFHLLTIVDIGKAENADGELIDIARVTNLDHYTEDSDGWIPLYILKELFCKKTKGNLGGFRIFKTIA